MASQFFTPAQSVIRKLPDGREIQAAVAGVPLSLADAIYYEILTDEDFARLAMQKPANYGTRYLGKTPTAGASALTTTARGTTVHARAEHDAGSNTTTIVANAPEPAAGATVQNTQGGGAASTTTPPSSATPPATGTGTDAGTGITSPTTAAGGSDARTASR